MWRGRETRSKIRDTKTSHRRKAKGKKSAGSRLFWILVWAVLGAWSFLFGFVAPILGGDSFAAVDGFVTTKPQPRQRISSKASGNGSSGSISTGTSAMQAKREEKTKDQQAFFTDEESPPLQPNGDELHQRRPLDPIFYRPSDPSEFATFDYVSNPTVFGSILRGELPTKLLLETKELIAFEDIKPRAPLHALVIPKTLIPSVLELGAENVNSISLLDKMSEVAHDLIQRKHPEAYRMGDYRLCFHIPPFNSVDHLHLHVLAPASAMAPIYKNGKYNTGSNSKEPFHVRWCIGLTEVEANLRSGAPPTPYRRDDGWTTVVSDLAASIRSVLLSSFE